jgi:hypothetical protein
VRRLGILSVLLASPLLGGCVVATSTRSSGSSGGIFFLFLPLVVFFLMARMVFGGRRRRTVMRQRQQPEVALSGGEPDVGMIRAELSVLADDVLRLEPQAAIHEGARDDYEAAAHRYRVAQAALDQDHGRVDLVRVQRVVDEATWAMARARAEIEGRRPPAPPAALQQPGPRGEPAVRLDERQRPTYVGSTEPFRAGWFAGGGLLGGLLLGPMLGGWFVQSGDGFDGDADDLRP